MRVLGTRLLTNRGLTLLLVLLPGHAPHNFDFSPNSDNELLEPFRPYASPDQLGDCTAVNPLRPDGYTLLSQPMLQSVPLSTSAKAFRYSSKPGIVELPP